MELQKSPYREKLESTNLTNDYNMRGSLDTETGDSLDKTFSKLQARELHRR